MKEYIASFTNNRGESWDLAIKAENWKTAAREARHNQKEYGNLYSVRLKK